MVGDLDAKICRHRQFAGLVTAIFQPDTGNADDVPASAIAPHDLFVGLYVTRGDARVFLQQFDLAQRKHSACRAPVAAYPANPLAVAVRIPTA